ncbi:MAG: potassium channel family protein [Chloroflexota bacterium]
MASVALVPRRLVLAVSLVLGIVLAGVIGYSAIEHWSWFDALYMTVTALTTLGGGEVRPLSTPGRVFTLLLVVAGVGTVTYTVLLLVGYVLEGELNQRFGLRRVRRRVQRLENHFVLCGYGRVGREIAHQFAAEGVPFVVIDLNEGPLGQAATHGYLVVTGNAAQVEVLQQAGLERARGLVTAVDSDADNIYVTLSARVLRPNLFIVARANDPEAEPKLRLAGANRIISPYTIGGRRMASVALSPTATDFIDAILSGGNAELSLEALPVPAGSTCIGLPLESLLTGSGTTILAVKRSDEMIYRPAAGLLLKMGDELIAAGPTQDVRRLDGALQGGLVSPHKKTT